MWKALIGAAGGLATSAYNNWQAGIQQAKAREENYRYNEMAAENANQRWRQNFQDFYTPSAQLEMIKEAGLSPSLMLSGGAGGGGGTAASPQGAGAQGLGNPYFPASALEAAQIAQLSAETEKTKAEKANISEETISQKIDNYINQTTLPQTIEQATKEVDLLKAEISKVKSETQGIDWKNAFNLITQDAQIEQLMNKNAELCARVEELEAKANLHDANASLTDTEREKMKAQIVKMQKDVAQRYIELDIYNDSVQGQNRWFDEQAFQGLKNIELRTDMFNFEKGEKWEFEKFKVGKQIQLAGWKIGLDFGASMLQTAVDAIGIKSAQGMKQLELDTKKEIANKPTHTQYYTIDKKGKKRITSGKYTN